MQHENPARAHRERRRILRWGGRARSRDDESDFFDDDDNDDGGDSTPTMMDWYRIGVGCVYP